MPNRWKPNVTVAAVIERAGRYLLVEEQTSQGLRLNNPAGHLDPGETLVQACRRETLEETAHGFTPTALVGVYLAGPDSMPSADASPRARTTYLRFAFCGELGDLEPDRALDAGIVRTVWMDIDEIRASRTRHRSPVLLYCIEDYIAGARYPLDLLSSDLGPGVRSA
ncbi:NUDIX hydrolase [Comamonadaceae bacterium G21597-S1]|nr:NUDIX hydrolase [Comamonadaceae bacterium G21597-S1]